MGEGERDHDHDKKRCGTVNFFCGDGGKHPDKKKDCCDPCESLERGHSYVGFEDIGYITPVAQDVSSTLIVNPAGSGKNLIITKRAMSVLGSDDHVALFKYYFNPQLNAPGVLGSVVNLNSGSLNASVGQIYTLPNVASPGTAIDAFTVGVSPYESNALLQLAPGSSLLVVLRANAENTRAGAFIYWTDCKIKLHHEDPDPIP